MRSTGRLRGAWRTLVRGLDVSPELRRGLGVTVVLALVASAGRVVVPVAVQQTLDRGITASGVDLRAVAVAVGGALVAVLVTAVASSRMNLRLARAVEHALARLRVRAFRHVHDLSVLHQEGQRRGGLVSRVTGDIDEISRFMQRGGIRLITAVGQLTVVLVVMLVYSWRLTAVVLASFVPFLLAARWFQLRLTRAYATVRERVADLLGGLAEVIVGAPVVRAYGIEQRTDQRLGRVIEAHRGASLRAGRLSASFSAVGELSTASAMVAAVLTAVWLGGTQVSLGTTAAFLFLINLFIEPVRLAAEVVNEAQTAIAGWRRVLDVLDTTPDVVDPGEEGVELPTGSLGVRLEGVAFRYPRADGEGLGAEVLHDIELSIDEGSCVALVGETGSGKTTIAKLAVRLMDPTAGRVLVGGVEADRISFASLRERVVLVPQDGSMFRGTVADNIALGREGGDRRAVEEAVARLGLGDWLDKLPQGLDTRVGERGSSLSMGQAQLVTLVRAELADPDLLVLDEATSAVDPATEARLQRALTGAASGRTTLIIAHRLSTAQAADEVVVVDGGRIVQRGAHSQLVDRPGAYARLHEAWSGVAG